MNMSQLMVGCLFWVILLSKWHSTIYWVIPGNTRYSDCFLCLMLGKCWTINILHSGCFQQCWYLQRVSACIVHEPSKWPTIASMYLSEQGHTKTFMIYLMYISDSGWDISFHPVIWIQVICKIKPTTFRHFCLYIVEIFKSCFRFLASVFLYKTKTKHKQPKSQICNDTIKIYKNSVAIFKMTCLP